MNLSALIVILALAGALLLVFGWLYRIAAANHAKGDLDIEGMRILRWALLGQLVIFAILAVTSFLT